LILLLAALAYYIPQRTIIAKQGRSSLLAAALGTDWKGKISPALYLVAMPLSFVQPWIGNAIYVLVADVDCSRSPHRTRLGKCRLR
jgi:hypothetical protein